MNKFLSKVGAAVLATAFAVTPSISVFAKTGFDTIDTSRKGSITLNKYDLTAYEADGGKVEVFTANGQRDTKAETELKDYAIKDVEFTYAKVANIITWSDAGKIEVMFDIPNDLAKILDLTGGVTITDKNVAGSVTVGGNVNPENANPMYNSAQINAALAKLLTKNTDGKNALEDYMRTLQGKTMVTDKKGQCKAGELDQGLYLVVETAVPANVYCTTNPFFVTVPMTNSTGTADNDKTHAGEYWFYNLFVYPKNQTDIPDLDKLVRQHDDVELSAKRIAPADAIVSNPAGNEDPYKDMHSKIDADVRDYSEGAYNHATYEDIATGSEGDIMDYIFVSHLPNITSKASFLKQYQFTDTMDKGLDYMKDTAIYFYENVDDARSNNIAKAKYRWTSDENSQNFEVRYDSGTSGHKKMIVNVTEPGLAAINHVVEGQTGKAVSEYSKLYMVVSYSAKINSDTSPILGDVGNTNEVTLDWQRTHMSHADSLVDRARVYTYGLNLTKIFESNEGANEQAAKPADPTKVQFMLQNVTDGHFVVASRGNENVAGVYYLTDGVKGVDPTGNDEGTKGTIFVPNAEGELIINGLEADQYQLTEIKTDDGFSLLKDPINFVIYETIDRFLPSMTTHYDSKDVAQNATDERNVVTEINGDRCKSTVDKNEIAMKEYKEQSVTSANAVLPIKITNTPSFKLPMTGGTGTLLCTMGGAAVAFAGVALCTRKRKGDK